MVKEMMLAIAAISAMVSFGAEPLKVKNNFPKPPVAALKALKAAVGRPFNSGWVFIDGKYIPPPYKVERYGTVLRINGNQICGELIPWNEFIKTQDGVKVTKSESAPAADVSNDAAAEPGSEADDSLDDSWESSLDDLFDDEPAAKKPAARKSTFKPRPKKPAVTVTYSFDGEFVMNDKCKALLEKINAARTKLDQHLRTGGFCCFSSRYAAVRVDSRAARGMMAKLPNLMRTSNSAEVLAQGIRANGFTYLPNRFIEDLFRNRVDYLILERRVKSESSGF